MQTDMMYGSESVRNAREEDRKMLNFISENSMLINALLTFATVVTSCITIISTNRNAKKQRQDSEAVRRQQQEQFDRSLKEQRI